VHAALRSRSDAGTDCSGEHAGIEAQGIAHERHRQPDLIVQLAREPPTGGDHLGGSPARSEPTGPGARHGTPTAHLRAEVRLIQRREQPQQQRTRADGTLASLPRPGKTDWRVVQVMAGGARLHHGAKSSMGERWPARWRVAWRS
jgi:hypothetical protein